MQQGRYKPIPYLPKSQFLLPQQLNSGCHILPKVLNPSLFLFSRPICGVAGIQSSQNHVQHSAAAAVSLPHCSHAAGAGSSLGYRSQLENSSPAMLMSSSPQTPQPQEQNGILDWLRKLRLHKYYPVFKQLTMEKVRQEKRGRSQVGNDPHVLQAGNICTEDHTSSWHVLGWFALSESSNELMKTFLLFSLCVVARAVRQLLLLAGFLMECLEMQLRCCLGSSAWLPAHPSTYLNILISLDFCFLVDFSPKIFGWPHFKKQIFRDSWHEYGREWVRFVSCRNSCGKIISYVFAL